MAQPEPPMQHQAVSGMQQVVQVRTRAVLHLPPEYEVVQAEIRAPNQRHAEWVSDKVAVRDGAAVLDFWARVPMMHQSVHIRLLAARAKGTLRGFCCKKDVLVPTLEAVLHIDPEANRPAAVAPTSPDALPEEPPGQGTDRTAGGSHVRQDTNRAAGAQHAAGTGGASSRFSGGSAWVPVALPLSTHASRLAAFGRFGSMRLGTLTRTHTSPRTPWPHTTNQDVEMTGAHASASSVTNAAATTAPMTLAQTSMPTERDSRLTGGLVEPDTDVTEVSGPGSGPQLLVEYCVITLTPEAARLPELELGEPLARWAHCYCHGGCMGAALSLLAEDDHWERIILEDLKESIQNKDVFDRVIRAVRRLDLLEATGAVTSKDLLVYMTVLENSPVLCAYGLQRSGCCAPALPVAGLPPPSTELGGLSGPWWLSGRPDTPNSTPPTICSAMTMAARIVGAQAPSPQEGSRGGGTAATGAPAGAKASEPQTLQWQQHKLPPDLLPSVLLEASMGRCLRSPETGLLVNRYGYSPLALEWDLWLDPMAPAELLAANVDHGSAMHLVQQAISMALRCNSVAKQLGRRHNLSAGVTPLQWLHSFGTALNRGVFLEPGRPLPLHCCWPPHPVEPGSPAVPLNAYPTGSQCPSLESYLQLTIRDLMFTVSGKAAVGQAAAMAAAAAASAAGADAVGAAAAASAAAEQKQSELLQRIPKGGLRCRMRLMGNTMSRPPIDVEVVKLPGPASGAAVTFRALLSKAWKELLASNSAPGGAGDAAADKDLPFIYPVHPEVQTSLLVIEVYVARLGKVRSRMLGYSVVPLTDLMQHAVARAGPRGEAARSASLVVRRRVHVSATAADIGVAASEAAQGGGEQGREASPPQIHVAPPVEPGMDAAPADPAATPFQNTRPSLHRSGKLGIRDIAEAMKNDSDSDSESGKHPRTFRPGLPDLGSGALSSTDDGDEDDGASVATLSTAFSGLTELSSMDSMSIWDGDALPSLGDGDHAAAHPFEMHLALCVKRMSVLEAAQKLYGLDAAVAQSCIAMLAAPGGLYLDIKSGYSKAKHHKWFASTLAGIGVNVKAICSFVPAQINFSKLSDTLPYGGHGRRRRTNTGASSRPQPLPPPVQPQMSSPLPSLAIVNESGEAPVALQPSPGPPVVAATATALEDRSSDAADLASHQAQSSALGIGVEGVEAVIEASSEPGVAWPARGDTGASAGSAGPVAEGALTSADPSVVSGALGHAMCTSSTPGGARRAGDTKDQPPKLIECAGSPAHHLSHASGMPSATGGADSWVLSSAAASPGASGARPVGEGVEPAGHVEHTASPGGASRNADDEGAVAAGSVAAGPGAVSGVTPPHGGAAGPAARISDGAAAAGWEDVVPTEGRLSYDSVLFFHGLNGLELACESGQVAPGTCVLFNGASLLKEDADELLKDPKLQAEALSAFSPSTALSIRPEDSEELLGKGSDALRPSLPDRVDVDSWRRYQTAVGVFKLYGGIYVQEPDASPASVAALVQLVNANPGIFPMGFAYGHLAGKAVAVAGHTGRGLAAQQLLEELSSRKRLSAKVKKWIRRGVHLGAGDEVYISWGRRLVYRPGLMYREEQYLVLQLLADYPDEAALPRLVYCLGGVKVLFLRYFQHYDATSPFTLFELGFNLNHTKALLRLLRNRGVLANLPRKERVELAVWLMKGTRGELARKLHYLGRRDVHKLAKEAFVCVAESCRYEELEEIDKQLGGPHMVRRSLRGWLKLQGFCYERRYREAREFLQARHQQGEPWQPAYLHSRYGYVQYMRPPPRDKTWASFASRASVLLSPDHMFVEEGDVLYTTDPRHTRPKAWVWHLWRLPLKLLVLVYTSFWNCCLLFESCCLWPLCCFPILCAPYCQNRIIPFIAALLLVLFLYASAGTAAATGGTLGAKALRDDDDPAPSPALNATLAPPLNATLALPSPGVRRLGYF